MKVAVVGAGATGLTAAYLLSEYSEHEVHLFDAADRAGGHAHALPVPSLQARAAGEKCTDEDLAWIETGFLVFNRSTYPNFCKLLGLLGVGAVPADISWSFSRGQGEYAWCSRGLRGVFVQPRNLLRARHWRMLWDMLRFNACAPDILRAGGWEQTIGDFLASNKYSATFRDDYLMPFVSAIWATPPGAAVLDFPIASLVRYMHNHHLMQVTKGPQWLTVAGSSAAYVDKILARIPTVQQHFSTPVHSVASNDAGSAQQVTLTTASGNAMVFDHVIMACHADQALAILERGGGVTPVEQDVLGGFTFSEDNHVIVHQDLRLMPALRDAWCAWNYLGEAESARGQSETVSMTFWMNLLQKIPERKFGTVLCSLNPRVKPRPELIIGECVYRHPHMTAASNAARADLPTIQNKRGITYAGAWSGFGFHEDAVTSAMRVVSQHLGVRLPFEIEAAERRRSLPDRIGHALERSFMSAAERIRVLIG